MSGPDARVNVPSRFVWASVFFALSVAAMVLVMKDSADFIGDNVGNTVYDIVDPKSFSLESKEVAVAMHMLKEAGHTNTSFAAASLAALQAELTAAQAKTATAQAAMTKAHGYFQKTGNELLSSGLLNKQQKVELNDEALADLYRRKAVEYQNEAKLESDKVLQHLKALTETGGSYSATSAKAATEASTKATLLVDKAHRYFALFKKYAKQQHILAMNAGGLNVGGVIPLEHKFAKSTLHKAMEQLMLAKDKEDAIAEKIATVLRTGVPAKSTLVANAPHP